MTTVIERSDTAVKERPRIRPPEPTAPRPRPRRAWYAWMVSLIVVAVAATAAILMITDEDAATIDYGSGESVYMSYDWYADLDGFYLPPPVGAPSGESVYMEYDWYEAMGGFYLPEPYGDMTTDSHYSWLVERGLIPEVYDLSTPGLQVVNADGVGWYYAAAPAVHSDYDWLVLQGIIPEAYDGPTSDYAWLVEQGIIPEAHIPAVPAGLQVVSADGVGWYYAPAPASQSDYEWLVEQGIIPQASDAGSIQYEWLMERGLIPEAHVPATN